MCRLCVDVQHGRGHEDHLELLVSLSCFKTGNIKLSLQQEGQEAVTSPDLSSPWPGAQMCALARINVSNTATVHAVCLIAMYHIC